MVSAHPTRPLGPGCVRPHSREIRVGGDIPTRPDPLPRFLDDAAAAKLMIAARAATDPRDRLVIEMLSRTGLRASEAAGLAADAVVHIGDGHWLRVPVGKLRNDRLGISPSGGRLVMTLGGTAVPTRGAGRG